ncbi:uncharacterized protein IL334_000337 [Kwoniella shivajii]|uniref:Peptidase A1 domain-containing protein n=1 Tax=Kwoniella shivajii TaxID=564305 RepID=A0ABZ1CT34_9TREE|nr:hypothetical protein IL334_000337 [Kwoniella shivajii]
MTAPASANAEVWISAASPLLVYSPSRNDVNSWNQIDGHGSQYHGSDKFTVGLDSFYFTNIRFFYTSPPSYQLQIGLDGKLQAGSPSTESTDLTSTFGAHSARLECSCTDCGPEKSNNFVFSGIMALTQVVNKGTALNATLDDTSSEITYSGFQSTSASKSTIQAIQKGSFYGKTISYTSTSGAAASFSFQGSAIYIFGMTGPEFGAFNINIDSIDFGIYNASTTLTTYDTLLFFTTYLDSDQKHQMSITNQNDGLLLALDYIVYTKSDIQGTATSAPSVSTATAVFPSQGSVEIPSRNSGDNAGAVIGGILGTLAGLFAIWLWWKYYQWKKAGGMGSFLAALCGGFKKKKEAKKEENKFHLWPMVWARPKYAT